MTFLWALAAMPASADIVPAPERVRAIAHDGYIFAYPLVLMEQTRSRQLAPLRGTPISGMGNLISILSLAGPGPQSVVRPNADTLYTGAWVDVSNEPSVFHLPDTNGRYCLVQLLDAWTDTFGDPGTRTTGSAATDVVIVGPSWHGDLPSGLKVYRSPTGLVWIIARAAARPTSDDIAAANALQSGYALAPLHDYAKQHWAYHLNVPRIGGRAV